MATKLKAPVSKLTKDQKDEVWRISRELIIAGIKDVQLEHEAIWLMALHNEFDFGAIRLQRFYEAVYRLRKEYTEEYLSDGTDGAASIAARMALFNATGLSMDDLHKGYPWIVSTQFTLKDHEVRQKIKEDDDGSK